MNHLTGQRGTPPPGIANPETKMAATQTAETGVRAALTRLGIERLVLSIHQASFPQDGDDVGYGTPYSERGRNLIEWLASLGFTAVALGPSGITDRTNPSPYDATALSRNPLHIALGPLSEVGLLDPHLLDAAVAQRPSGQRVHYEFAWSTQRRLLQAAAEQVRDDPHWNSSLAQLQQVDPWLENEARFEAAAAAIGHENWRRWPAAPPRQSEAAHRFLFTQLLVRQQHASFLQHAHQVGLGICADLPIGTSHRDRYLFSDAFLPGYAMGAPPSRTNPDGQPWGYPVLHPEKLQPGAAAWRYAALRIDALLSDHDSLRIDHPHGWVCPWVYRTDDPDPLHAVQHGARLYESPDLPDHPALAAYARVGPEQIDYSQPRHDDRWLRSLSKSQVDRYAQLLDLIVQRVRRGDGQRGDLLVEVLSTCPRPLAEVLARYRLGRYRVTQKAKLTDPHDVYRSDRARAEDWIMVGNHDTPPLRAVIQRWQGSDQLSARVDYLVSRLVQDPQQRAPLANRLRRDPNLLATAMLADLFCGPARNVLIFWVDLFGLSELYNRPGVVDAANWSLRVPANFEQAYQDARDRNEAPRLEQAVAWALHARGLDQDSEGQALVDQLSCFPP
jgi:4-alpha-glucanotransferase